MLINSYFNLILNIIAWCPHSQEFLQEFDKLANYLYKIGELTDTIFFAKINGDNDPGLVEQYAVDGYPGVILVK